MTEYRPEDVRDALASVEDDYEIRRELHDVPPHAVYEVTVDSIRAVCKVAREPRAEPATEARVMEFVGRETEVPVPEILAVGDDWFVAEWCDGLPGDDPAFDAECARTMGTGLATLHDQTVGEFEETGFPRAESGRLVVDARDSWNATVLDLLADLRDYLADFGYAEEAEEVRSLLTDHPDLLARAGDPVLAHGNYLLDHVAVVGGDVTRVIDWEHALVAPAGYDYWRTAMPHFAGPDAAAEREAFREGYASVRPLPAGVGDGPLADVYRLVNAISYLKSVHLQRPQTGQARARFAASAQQSILETIEELRSEGQR
jgi:Ser/Thr protein kinase RdoA (MazF antagonist)